ncbi:glycoside hydrolase family 76 protein [Lasiosphaeria hispida]|uniref:Glycoside hydrolase family 76 protein n=1 Tax=Lasiosphaeria hispida TaxID=260671 RepID=A0AAJ0MDF0_9PEZI|nr:glycoside hydrolase family 76 protein [Lasiosphaeria hispida]
MVSLRWGGLAARAALFVSTHSAERASTSSYTQNAHDATTALQSCIATVMSNTFIKAQSTAATAQKTVSLNGMVSSKYSYDKRDIAARGFSNFLNEYYDDEGWWALAWIRAWDVTQNDAFLSMAELIFADMQNGTDDKCGGGIWWSKDRAYKNAIANELYLSVAASLANRVPGYNEYYLDIAKREWAWFKSSGMINEGKLINDGLRINANGSCVNNGLNTWSYNQGVVLGGLAELSRASGDKSYLNEAVGIGKAAIKLLSDNMGVIHESGGCEPNCGGDGSQFKGIFMRNLHYLHSVAPQDEFRTVILANADSIWANDRDAANNRLGISWTGPASAGGGPNASTHSSAMDVLVAAMAVS